MSKKRKPAEDLVVVIGHLPSGHRRPIVMTKDERERLYRLDSGGAQMGIVYYDETNKEYGVDLELSMFTAKYVKIAGHTYPWYGACRI